MLRQGAGTVDAAEGWSGNSAVIGFVLQQETITAAIINYIKHEYLPANSQLRKPPGISQTESSQHELVRKFLR